MLFLNRYTKGRGLPGCKSVRAVERSHRYSNSSAWCSASRSEWLDILQKGMLCCRRTEGENCKCESRQRPSGTVTPPPKRHASYTTVTLQLLALHKAPHTKSMQITWPTGRVWHFGWSAHLHWRGEVDELLYCFCLLSLYQGHHFIAKAQKGIPAVCTQ